jgi:hypothetical protein
MDEIVIALWSPTVSSWDWKKTLAMVTASVTGGNAEGAETSSLLAD